MHSVAPTPRFHPERFDTPFLDCVAVNVAAWLQLEGVEDLRTPFATEWHFAWRDGLPSPDVERRPLAERVRALAGYALETHDGPAELLAPQVMARVEAGERVLVVGDAIAMPWLPYFGRESMAHGFLVLGVARGSLRVLDAYRNATEWGEALPCETTLPVDALPSVVQRWSTLRRVAAPSVDVPAVLLENARVMREQAQAIARYGEAMAARVSDGAAMKQLSLGCWLVYRARALHGLWLAQHSPEVAAVFTAEVVERWRRANELAYLVYRRARSGKAAPVAVFDVLQTVAAHEQAIAERLG